MSKSPRRAPVVAIDGPAGAGKSSVSQRVAAELGFLLLDTGALYRSVSLAALREAAESAEDIARVANELVERDALRCEQGPEGQRVFLDGEDVSRAIRTPEIGMLASRVSAIPEVRGALLAIQRRAGEAGRVVVEGRDIGSVVFPDAEAKFFLTASVQTRAQRRFEELKNTEPDLSLADITDQVEERDRRDSSRPVSPLVRAEDAVLIDSTGKTIDQVVSEIVSIVRQRQALLESFSPERSSSRDPKIGD